MPTPDIKLKPPETMKYWSVVPERRPASKLHSNLGHAKNALNGKMSYAGYRWDDPMYIYERDESGEWNLLYQVNKGDREPPWRAGELEEKARKERAAAVREEERVEKKIRSMAEAEWRELTDGMRTPAAFDQFLEGYKAGFRNARKLYFPNLRRNGYDSYI